MRTCKYLVTLAAMLTLVLSLQAGEKGTSGTPQSEKSVDAESIKWLSYSEALTRARAESVHVYIDFSRKGCGWCRKMERETYTNPDVIKMLNEHYAPTKVRGDSNDELDIDGYKITERALAIQEFGVTSYPQLWFLTPDNAKVGPLRGYLAADRFLKALEYVKEFKYDTTRTQSGRTEESAEK